MHVGWHVDPEANVAVQSPTPPLAGATDASHGFGEHVAADVTPSDEHVVLPDTV